MNSAKSRAAVVARFGSENAVVFDERGRPSLYKMFSIYTVDVAAISTGASGSGSFTVQTDSDFVIQQITGRAWVTTTEATVTDPIATVQITDTGSQFNLFSAPTYWSMVFGTAQLPFILPVPRLVKANAKVNVTINVVLETTADNEFQIAFIGHRLYSLG